MKSILPVLAALLLLAAPRALRAQAPSRQEVLVAIGVLERHAVGPDVSSAARTIMVYAQDSDDVMVDIGPAQVPWAGEKWGLGTQEIESQAVMLASFVAGNIHSQIKNDRAEDDTYSGWLFALRTYERLRAVHPFSSPALDELQRLRQEGSLLEHAREAGRQEPPPDDAPARKGRV